ncbi:metal ABC transporter substrate-binding protein [Natrinema hispanicum]|uniref:Zinc transport system substrate-binding protein n=1 Tax=Natrinema hispanicum TaxID=392421 RepID=A0A1G6WB84_9EURY|nr:metal ABC transporter substrate-binding protein [Natrinema hispanicum]SDD62316.1 zinc transport system substrate-binding protein [Natrinema hispanicum]SEU09367.1 zinc transport system substrate-binding protein [Natrinema hispanicum]
MAEHTRRRFVTGGIGAVAASALAGCLGGSGQSSGTTGQASFFVFGDIASQVAGDAATGKTLVPVGQHGHGWEPGPRVQQTVLESNLFIHGMEGFQPWADDIVETIESDGADVAVVDASAGVQLQEPGHSHEQAHDHEDEHEAANQHGESPPWEWAGLYHLETGTYTYTFEQGPDPQMHLAVLSTDEGGDHGIHHVEETAHSLYESDHSSHTTVEADGTLSPSSESLYTLEFAENGATTYTLQVESEGHYVLFAQHVPSEFNAALSNEGGASVTPEVTEAVGGHDHGHETEDDHENEDGHDHGHGHAGGMDPHFWIDPVRAKTAVDNIQQGFANVDSENSSTYKSNATQYKDKLDDLHSSLQSGLEGASKDVVFVAGHNAFGYLGARYGFEVKTLTSISPDDQPTPRDIEQAQQLISEHDLQYVCSDPLESQQAAQQLVAETDATEVLPLTSIPGQTQEWADKDWGYVDVMKNVNLPTLQKALDA